MDYLDYFLNIVQNYGYFAVFLGSLIEGESIILAACVLAAAGHLNIYKIMIIAFIGTLIADQALYYLGRYYGQRLFDRFPFIHKQAERANRLLRKYDRGFILICRFIYGIRIISSAVVGAAGIPPKRFIPLNFIAALIWSVVSCTAGYFIGETIFYMLERLAQYRLPIIVGIFGLIGGIVSIRYYRKSKSKMNELL